MSTRNWQGIVVHHTASPGGFWQNGGYRPLDVATVRGWHLNNGWRDIGYHYLIHRNGRVEPGRPASEEGAHAKAGGRNHTALGVALAGNFEHDTPTPEQFAALVNLVQKLQKKYRIKTEAVELHRSVPGAQTLCPGRYFPSDLFYQKLKG